MMSKRTMTFLSLFLLAGGPYPSFAQQGEQASRSTPSKVAIFPFGSDTECIGRSRPSDEKLASEVERLIRGNDSLELAYSYYNKDRNHPPIKSTEPLWAGRGGKPNATRVFTLGEARGVDVVVTYWRARAGLSYCEERMLPFRIDVYVFDVKQRKTYRQKGREKHLNAITEQALSKFLAGRPPQVVATAPLERDEIKNIRQGDTSNGPSERISLPPGGSVSAIKAAAAAYCGTLNKQSRLIAAPPNNPEYVFGCYAPTEAASRATPTTVAKAAPTIGTGTTTPAKVAIFPFGNPGTYGWCIGTTRPSHAKLASEVERLIRGNDSLTLAYSYYDKDRNYPPIKKPERLWAGRGARPNATRVFTLGEARGVDVVVMSWRTIKATQNCDNQMPPFPMDVYVFDVKQRKTYRQKGREKHLNAITEQALSKFLAGRPRQVVVAKATASQPATVTPTPPPKQKVVAPTVAETAPAATAPGTVILVGGTTVPVQLIENINSKYNSRGELVYLRVTDDIKVGDKVAIPKGALVKAKVGDIAKRGMMGKAGGLTFHPVAVAALDGQWISLDREDFGAHGAGASVGGIVGIGLFAKGAAGYVLRGTYYEVTVRRDAVIDTGKSKPLASLRKANLQTTARFQAVRNKIKFARGKPGKDFVLDVTLTQDMTPLVQQDPSTIEIVKILDHVLQRPIKPIKVVLDPRKNNFISATFAWWSIVKYSQPGKTPMTVQLELSDGRLVQTQATLETEWKLK